MLINFPKEEVTLNLSSQVLDWLKQRAIDENRSVDNIVTSAAMWYQRITETEGAREAVQALMPQLRSKIEHESN